MEEWVSHPVLWVIIQSVHLWMLRDLRWYTYSLEVSREAEDWWNSTISQSDNLTGSVKILLFKMLTAQHWWITCSESLSLQSRFPLLPHIFVFGKPSKRKRDICKCLHENIVQSRLVLFFHYNVLPVLLLFIFNFL